MDETEFAPRLEQWILYTNLKNYTEMPQNIRTSYQKVLYNRNNIPFDKKNKGMLKWDDKLHEFIEKSLYKRNQYWEWISTVDNPEALKTISVLLNLPQEYIRKHNGAFFINVKKRSNYDELGDIDKKVLEEQLNEMIKQKYTFINYNIIRTIIKILI